MSHEHAVFHSFMQNNIAAATTIIKIGVLQSTHYFKYFIKSVLIFIHTIINIAGLIFIACTEMIVVIAIDVICILAIVNGSSVVI